MSSSLPFLCGLCRKKGILFTVKLHSWSNCIHPFLQSRDILATRAVPPGAIPIFPSLHAPKTSSRRNVADIAVVLDTNATIVTVPTLQSAKEAQVGQKIIGILIGSTVVVDALLPITEYKK